MNKIVMALAATLMAMTAQVASAASTFNFSFSGMANNQQMFTGNGVFSVADPAVGPFDGGIARAINGISGTVTLGNRTATVDDENLASVGEGDDETLNFIIDRGAGNYDLAFLALAFQFDPTTVLSDFAIFSLDQINLVIQGDSLVVSDAEFNIAAIPEPATWAMMLLGFAFVAAALRRRRPAMLAA